LRAVDFGNSAVSSRWTGGAHAVAPARRSGSKLQDPSAASAIRAS
jgi:hypothetical protein